MRKTPRMKASLHSQPPGRSDLTSIRVVVLVAALVGTLLLAIIVTLLWLILKLCTPIMQPTTQGTQVIVIVATPTPTLLTDTPVATGVTLQTPASTTPTQISATVIAELPQIKTATPPPYVPITITITNEQATELTAAIVASEDLPLNNLQATITESEIILTGDYQSGLIPVAFEAIAQPFINDERLRLQVTSITLGDTSLSDTPVRTDIEHTLNDAFDRSLRGKRVQSFDLDTGLLAIYALQRP